MHYTIGSKLEHIHISNVWEKDGKKYICINGIPGGSMPYIVAELEPYDENEHELITDALLEELNESGGTISADTALQIIGIRCASIRIEA